MTRRYAAGTAVPVSKTKHEIETLLRAKGATATVTATADGWALVLFEMKGRRVRFRMPLFSASSAKEKGEDGRTREQWRALLLAIKAKFVNAETGIETFEEAFLAQIVTPDGKTMGEHAVPALAKAYATQKMPALLQLGPGDAS